MTTAATIDDLGFHRARLDQILADLQATFRGIFGSDVDLGPESPDAQIIGTVAEAISDLASLAEAVYNGRSAAGARGAALARLVRLNGITKSPATFSLAPVALSGVSGTLIPAGSIVNSATVPPTVWTTIADLTIPGSSTGTVNGIVQASVTGPTHGAAGTLTVIKTVIAGWTTATNTADASLGTFEETDAALRVRRALSVALSSQGTVDGLQGAIAQLPTVAHVTVFENATDVVDANGLPRHSIRVVVDGGALPDIARQIWIHRSMGCTLVGSIEQDFVDSQGVTRQIFLDRPTPAPIYVIVNLAVAVNDTVKASIRSAIVAWGQANSGIGDDVPWAGIFVPVNSVPGLNVTSIFIGLSPSPTQQANVVIAAASIATWDALTIAVNP